MEFKDRLQASYRANYKRWKKNLTGGSITPDMAEDIIQLACVKALSGQSSYDSSRSFDNWFEWVMANARGEVISQERHGGMTGRSL